MGYFYYKQEDNPQPSFTLPRVNLPVKTRKILAGIFLTFGVFIFSSALFPIIQFQLEYSSKFGQIINPLSAKFYNNTGGVLGEVSSTDYTQLNNWFVTDEHTASDPRLTSGLSDSGTSTYHLSIPELNIKDAVVAVGSMDLKKSLIQYPQTALPGQLGNGVIFGHSVLPQFFNPKSYLTIFSTLYRLKIGDPILIDYDGVHYKYLIEEMFEVAPTDLSVLEQRFDGRYFSLITCSPPGTVLRRLVVRARIADL